jgi:ABC-type antimicrobial peptide transport system permease subunit
VCVWWRVSENSREFGILRALGLSVPEVMRVFLYEAVAVVLSSFFLGTVIGRILPVVAHGSLVCSVFWHVLSQVW